MYITNIICWTVSMVLFLVSTFIFNNYISKRYYEISEWIKSKTGIILWILLLTGISFRFALDIIFY